MSHQARNVPIPDEQLRHYRIVGNEAEDDEDWLVEVVRARSITEFERQLAEWRRTTADRDVHIRWRTTRRGRVSYRALARRRRNRSPGPSATFVEVEHDGWVWHDYTPLGGDMGDAWIEAPDHSYVGIIWNAGAEVASVQQIGWDDDSPDPPDHQRWGLLRIDTPLPMTSAIHARSFLLEFHPLLSQRWKAWKQAGRRA